jgi:type II secretory pathway pseudopilin PulG
MKMVDSAGYTILEVMLFMAISSFMFVIAANAVSGKQDNIEFRQAMNDINSQVRDAINDVNNGLFSSTQTFSCTANSIGSAPKIDPIGPSASNQSQGTNKSCTFIGKAIQFSPAGTEDKEFKIYTIAGRQYKGKVEDAIEVENLDEAKPTAITGYNMVSTQTLRSGLRVTDMKGDSGALTGVAFYKSFGKYEQTGGALVSRNQDVVAVPIAGPNNGGRQLDESTMAQAISNERVAVSTANIRICFKGAGDRVGLLRIGGLNGQRLTTSIKISDSDSICA